jgi:drug/metabolite transporter (DMT)-like permease
MAPEATPATAPGRTAAIALCTAGALCGFAANSLLTRLALGAGEIDAASFASIRLLTGALTLSVLVRLRRRSTAGAGTWTSAAALAAYAIAFSFAYVRIGASAGALLLFGSVQATMIAWGVVRGERPGVRDWAGMALSIGGLIGLTAPGIGAPDPIGSMLMVAAGIAWGVYSLRGRRATDPMGATAINFVRSVGWAALASAVTWAGAHASTRGIVLATISGSITSGLAYTLWYTALPSLSAWRAAVLQLSVPVLTAAGAVVLLDEAITPRLVLCGLLVLGGVLLAVRGSGVRA